MRALVVEDEVRLGSYLKRGLEAEGYAVDVAVDGAKGLWLAREQLYDVIVLDIMLPELNGYQVCAELRGDDNWTPVLMLTAKDGEYDIAEALDSGADDYLVKPFSFVELLARLRALIRRGKSARPVVLEAGDLKLDPAKHRFWRGDSEIELTQREFALIEFLMRRSGDAVSKLEILNNVWDWAFDGDPNIVEVYVGYLRRKIDAPFDRKSIETVRGVGYRLDPEGG
ncbi:MAG: response regulator transcription factor [Acidimicrobiia bacterium]|nr:response regulator transcription factor [Acidimicrobiia bacterium]MDH3471741.1 response regulator transcription factor [Acidimicrobiia bacterium]